MRTCISCQKQIETGNFCDDCRKSLQGNKEIETDISETIEIETDISETIEIETDISETIEIEKLLTSPVDVVEEMPKAFFLETEDLGKESLATHLDIDNSIAMSEQMTFKLEPDNLDKSVETQTDMVSQMMMKSQEEQSRFQIDTAYQPANQPTYQPANPTYQPANPTYQAANPTYQAANPTYQPANPTYQPANPTYQPSNQAPSYHPYNQPGASVGQGIYQDIGPVSTSTIIGIGVLSSIIPLFGLIAGIMYYRKPNKVTKAFGLTLLSVTSIINIGIILLVFSLVWEIYF